MYRLQYRADLSRPIQCVEVGVAGRVVGRGWQHFGLDGTLAADTIMIEVILVLHLHFDIASEAKRAQLWILALIPVGRYEPKKRQLFLTPPDSLNFSYLPLVVHDSPGHVPAISSRDPRTFLFTHPFPLCRHAYHSGVFSYPRIFTSLVRM